MGGQSIVRIYSPVFLVTPLQLDTQLGAGESYLRALPINDRVVTSPKYGLCYVESSNKAVGETSSLARTNPRYFAMDFFLRRDVRRFISQQPQIS